MDLRRIDALVAQHVMGWQIVDCYGYLSYDRGPDLVDDKSWRPTEDIAAAWEVLVKMNADHAAITHLEVGAAYPTATEVTFQWCESMCADTLAGTFVKEKVRAATAPLAICLAALKAKGVEVPA